MPPPALMYILGYRTNPGEATKLVVVAIMRSDSHGSLEAMHHGAVILNEKLEFWKNRYPEGEVSPPYAVTHERAVNVVQDFLRSL
jgi:hypothetical protein